MGDVHYVESGAGQAVVLLHAFPLDARMWDGARALLEQQARVITPDQRGLGESSLDGSPAKALADAQRGDKTGRPSPSLDQAAADVVALLDTLELDRVILGGCSMGGYVAMSVLRTAPDRVKGLILADTKAAADTAEQRNNRLQVAARAEEDGTDGWLADSMLGAVLGATTQQGRPEVVSSVRDMIETQPPEGVAWAQRAMAARPDSTEVLRGFSHPALVLVGEEDSLTPPDSARDLAAVLPSSELVILPRVGHLAAVEDPGSFVSVVQSWISAVS